MALAAHAHTFSGIFASASLSSLSFGLPTTSAAGAASAAPLQGTQHARKLVIDSLPPLPGWPNEARDCMQWLQSYSAGPQWLQQWPQCSGAKGAACPSAREAPRAVGGRPCRCEAAASDHARLTYRGHRHGRREVAVHGPLRAAQLEACVEVRTAHHAQLVRLDTCG